MFTLTAYPLHVITGSYSSLIISRRRNVLCLSFPVTSCSDYLLPLYSRCCLNSTSCSWFLLPIWCSAKVVSQTLCFFVWSMAQLLSHVWLFATPWIVARQAALSTECSEQDYWSGVPFLTPGLFLTQGSNPHLLHRLHWLPLSYLLKNPTGSFSSVTQSCPTLCDPMDCSTSGLPVHHQLPEFTQTHIHWVSDASQPSHPLLSPASPPTFNLSQHQGLFKWVSFLHQVAKVLEF